MGRTLHPNPDHVIDARLTTCPKCEAVASRRVADPATDLRAHRVAACAAGCDPGAPVRGRCACCGERVTAEALPGLEQGSPFGRSIAAMVVYLHYAHAIGMERLATLMGRTLWSLDQRGSATSWLALANRRLMPTIEKVVLASPVVCSDETSARVNRKKSGGNGCSSPPWPCCT